MIRSTTILNDHGDVTIVWTEDQDAAVVEVIRKKMSEGVAFFIIEPRMFGLLPPKRTRLKDADEARRHRALAVGDEDFGKLLSSGIADTARTPAAPVKGSRKSKNPEEVAKSQSVGVRPMRGG